MVSNKIVVRIPKGIHLKPAGFLCNAALEYESKITLCIGMKQVNAKSVLGVLSACVKENDQVEIVCEGPDEEKALAAIMRNIEQGLGEKNES